MEMKYYTDRPENFSQSVLVEAVTDRNGVIAWSESELRAIFGWTGHLTGFNNYKQIKIRLDQTGSERSLKSNYKR